MIKMPNVQVGYTKLAGGLDLTSPLYSLQPGVLIDCRNYEPGIAGGYNRIDGYERFDGRAAPSSAAYWLAPVSLTGTVAVGDTVTGAVSGASGRVLRADAGTLVLGRVAGSFTGSEVLNVAGSPVATLTGAVQAGVADTPYLDATYRALAADDRRADIQAVPGSGPVLGVVAYRGAVYAWRNNAGGTAAAMFKATASGWSAVVMPYEMAFASGTVAIAEGDLIVGGSSGATALVRRVMTRTGSWGTNAAGTLIVDFVAGSWQQGEAIKVGATAKASAASPCAQVTLAPGGRYEFVQYDFFGSADKFRLYGCDGKNPAFEFDGVYYMPIHTGMASDTPSFVAAHKNMLFLSFGGSLQNSAVSNPYNWNPTAGAAEIAMGEAITGLWPQPGNVLAIYTRNHTYQLVGSSALDFVLQFIAPETGAIPYTTQNLGFAYGLDDRGFQQVSQSLNYGNFVHSTVSLAIQPLIDRLKPKAVASLLYRDRNQYRLLCNDGSGIVMFRDAQGNFSFTKLQYPFNVACAWSGEDTDGTERVFLGSSDGMVYEAKKGTSFDGAAISAFIELPYNTERSPRFRKFYRKIVLEMRAAAYAEIRFSPEFSFGDSDVATHPELVVQSEGRGGHWDIDAWDAYYWDGKTNDTPEFSIAGTGTNLSLIFYSNTAIDAGHALNGVFMHYSVRRISR